MKNYKKIYYKRAANCIAKLLQKFKFFYFHATELDKILLTKIKFELLKIKLEKEFLINRVKKVFKKV